MDASPVSRKIRVLVAGNSRIHTQLLANALEQDPDLIVISWGANSSSPVPAIVSQKVDVLAIGSDFAAHTAVALKIVRELRSSHPETKSVLLLESQEAELIVDAFRSGARGVFSRESSVDLFRKCIRSVDQGEIWADNRAISLALEALASSPVIRTLDSAGLNLLSKREFEVVECVVQGMTNREIAERLALSQHTVKNYLFRVFDKLGVSSRVELLFMTLVQNSNVSRDRGTHTLREILLQSFEGRFSEGGQLALVEKAAQEGVPAAQFLLGESLAAVSERDGATEAYMWFIIAAEQACQAQARLASKLTATQIEEAQGKALNWMKGKIRVGTLFHDADETALQIASLAQEEGRATRTGETARKTEPDSASPGSTEPVLTYGSA